MQEVTQYEGNEVKKTSRRSLRALTRLKTSVSRVKVWHKDSR